MSCCTAVSFAPSFNTETRTIARLCVMRRTGMQLHLVMFSEARCLCWCVLAVHICLGCQKQWVSGNLSGRGNRLEFKFLYAKELLFWAKFVGGVLVCFCKCWSLVPVNSSAFSRSLPASYSMNICIPSEWLWILSACQKPALWLGPYTCSEKLSQRATQVCVGAQSTD